MSTRQASRQLEKLIDSAYDASLTMLDSCCIAKDVLTQVKKEASNTSNIFYVEYRAMKEESLVDKRITALKSVRRKLRKETLKCLRPLKRMKNKSRTADIPVDCNLSITLDTLREARVTMIAILESLLSFIPTTGLDGKTTMRSFATKVALLGNHSLEEISDAAGSHCAKKRLDVQRSLLKIRKSS